MNEWRGWKFPDGEKHLIEWMTTSGDIRHGRPAYQGNKYDAAMWLVRRRRVAIDVGANVGLWSWMMLHDFDELRAVEPVPAYAECWKRNIPRGLLHEVALGAAAGVGDMVRTTPGSCGDTTIDNGQPGERVAHDVEIQTLDSWGLDCVDLIKIDAEGYELFILRGAGDTLVRCRPVVVVEQKAGHGAAFGLGDTDAVDYLKGLGMTLESVISGDYILSFR